MSHSHLPVLLIVLPILSILAPTPASADQPQYYMLLEAGNHHYYNRTCTGELGFESIITQVLDGVSYQHMIGYLGGPPLEWDSYYHMDESGDVWSLPSPIAPEDTWTMFMDVPLTPGKSWGTSWGEYGENHCTYTVGAAEIVHTGFGTFTAIPIHYEEQVGADQIIGIYWYADGYGLVSWVLSCAYCEWNLADAVIGVDKTTWGSLKSLYR